MWAPAVTALSDSKRLLHALCRWIRIDFCLLVSVVGHAHQLMRPTMSKSLTRIPLCAQRGKMCNTTQAQLVFTTGRGLACLGLPRRLCALGGRRCVGLHLSRFLCGLSHQRCSRRLALLGSGCCFLCCPSCKAQKREMKIFVNYWQSTSQIAAEWCSAGHECLTQ